MIQLLLLFTTATALTVPLKAVSGSRPSKLRASVPSSHSHLVSTTVENELNMQYNALFSIGSPGQTLNLVLDTGSSYIWVPSINCSCHSAANYFNYSASSSYHNSSQSITLEYGIGTVKGTLSKETISIENLTATNQDFVLANMDRDLDSLASDGLMGLGFNSLSDNYPTFIETLWKQGQIDRPIFSVYLNNYHHPYFDSAFTIGDYNFELYGSSDIKSISIDPRYGYWLAIASKVGYGGKTTVDRLAAYAVLDIGTSLISGISNVVAKFKRAVQKKAKCYDFGYLICECTANKYDGYPSLDFTIDNQMFSVTADSYIYYESGYCYVLVESNTYGFWILGQPFFREYYSAYDMKNNTVLLSKAVGRNNYNESKAKGINFFILAAGAGIVSVLGYLAYNRKNRDPLRYSLIRY